MWLLRQKSMAISEKYFDHHPLLFCEQARELEEQIRQLEKLPKLYNSLKGWRVQFESKYRRKSHAVWLKIVEPYAVAHIEKLRAEDRPEEVTS